MNVLFYLLILHRDEQSGPRPGTKICFSPGPGPNFVSEQDWDGNLKFFLGLLAWLGGDGRKGKEKKGVKVAFVGVEPTPAAILADVLSQLD